MGIKKYILGQETYTEHATLVYSYCAFTSIANSLLLQRNENQKKPFLEIIAILRLTVEVAFRVTRRTVGAIPLHD